MKHIFFILMIALLSSCGDVEIADPFDPNAQRNEDISRIEAYIEENELGTPDTTEAGGRFIILETGEGEEINYGEVIGIDYIAYSIEGNVFDTSLPEVADTAFTNAAEFLLEPQFFNYTESGWTFRQVFRLTSQFASIGNFEAVALGEAMTLALKDMKLGGKLIVFLPSDQAFGAERTSFFEAYSVIVYEIFPVAKLQ